MIQQRQTVLCSLTHTGLKDACTFNFHHLCVLNLIYTKWRSLLSCLLTTTVVLGAKCFWAVRKMWWYAENTGCRIVGFIIHVLHPCVSPRKTSLACLPVCANCLVDVWTCHSCSYVNPGWMTTWKDFLRVLGGAVRNSPERTMFFSSFWAELAELPTDVWLFPGISSACTSLDSHYLLVQSWSTLEQHWNWP